MSPSTLPTNCWQTSLKTRYPSTIYSQNYKLSIVIAKFKFQWEYLNIWLRALLKSNIRIYIFVISASKILEPNGARPIYSPGAGLWDNFHAIAHTRAGHRTILVFSFLHFRHSSIKVMKKMSCAGGNNMRPGYNDCQDWLAQCLVSPPAAVASMPWVQLEEL